MAGTTNSGAPDMSVTEALEIMEANCQGLSARNIETSGAFQSFTDKTNQIQEDIGALTSHLEAIKQCREGLCALNWKPVK